MFAALGDDGRGVDSVKLVVAVSPVGGGDIEIQAAVGGVGYYVALVFPAFVVGGVGILHHSDEGTFAPSVLAVEETGDND